MYIPTYYYVHTLYTLLSLRYCCCIGCAGVCHCSLLRRLLRLLLVLLFLLLLLSLAVPLLLLLLLLLLVAQFVRQQFQQQQHQHSSGTAQQHAEHGPALGQADGRPLGAGPGLQVTVLH